MPRSERTYSAPREFTTTAELHVTDSIPTPPKKVRADMPCLGAEEEA
jgi:hypothetical protein